MPNLLIFKAPNNEIQNLNFQMNFHNLLVLDLSHNHINHIDKKFLLKFPSLMELNLDNNNI